VTQPQPRPGGQPRVAEGERAVRVAARAAAATPGPWGYLRASRSIVAAGVGEIAACCHDPDAWFIAHARVDVPWLLGQLVAERAALAALERRPDALRAAVGCANQALDRLLWEGDGLLHLVAEGAASAEIVAMVHAVASALDPEALGLKDGAP
jgi:hypothetical protein